MSYPYQCYLNKDQNEPYESTSTGLCIYPKDVQRITGKSYSHCRGLMQTIREKLSKGKHYVITPEEFSTYMGLSLNEVKKHLQN